MALKLNENIVDYFFGIIPTSFIKTKEIKFNKELVNEISELIKQYSFLIEKLVVIWNTEECL